eukprot:2983494-Amphidinium_carterae.2
MLSHDVRWFETFDGHSNAMYWLFGICVVQTFREEYSGCTEPFPAAAHDVRCVRTSMSTCLSQTCTEIHV